MPDDGTLLPDREFGQLQEIADQFGAARMNGPVEDWLPFIPPRDDALHLPVLVELVKIDLDFAWREKLETRVEEYAQRFPRLDPMPVGLLLEEYRVRQRAGDKPTIESYQARFPHEYEEFARRARALPAEATRIPSVDSTSPKAGAAPAGPLPPVFPDGYKPVALLGRGNFGEVWRAEAPGGVEVALKVVTQPLDNEGAQRELQALELIKKLRHPALLSTLAFWNLNNRLVIACELADETLRDRLRTWQSQGKAGIPTDELLPIFQDAAAGLDFLHWQGILHRDIKPENILLVRGYAKVADFGLARAQNRPMMSVSFAGTPAFMAPEVWGGKASKQSDQYSLAFTYAELRMGRRPLDGADFVQVMTSALEHEPNLEGLSAAEQAVLRRALAKKPEQRFDSCQDFVEALEKAVYPGGTTRRRPNPSGKGPAAEGGDATERSLHAGDWPAAGDPSATLLPGAKSALGGALATPINLNTDDAPSDTVRKGDPTDRPVWRPGSDAAKKTPTSKKPLILLVGAVAIGVVVVGVVILIISQNKVTPTHPTTSTTTSVAVTSAPIPTTTSSTTGTVPSTDPFLPPGYVAAVGSKLVPFAGRQYHDRIARAMPQGPPVVFVLLRPVGPADPRPFYAMEHKAWNGLMRQFRTEKPGAVTVWKDGPDDFPAMGLTHAEATACAAWLGGALPSPKQWDYAAGLTHREGRVGPATGPRLVIDSDSPRAVHEDTDDLSVFQVRDLAGNGREFTQKTIRVGPDEFVILRGRIFKLKTPLTFAILEAEQDPKNEQRQLRDKPSPYTGFRAVIEIPEGR